MVYLRQVGTNLSEFHGEIQQTHAIGSLGRGAAVARRASAARAGHHHPKQGGVEDRAPHIQGAHRAQGGRRHLCAFLGEGVRCAHQDHHRLPQHWATSSLKQLVGRGGGGHEAVAERGATPRRLPGAGATSFRVPATATSECGRASARWAL